MAWDAIFLWKTLIMQWRGATVVTIHFEQIGNIVEGYEHEGVTVVTAKDAREHCQKLMKQRHSVRVFFLEAPEASKMDLKLQM